MIVCIAEKPSVAKDIARILGADKDCRDRNRHGYYEGNGYQVTWTYGHLCELKNPEEYSPRWKSWALSTLPMIPPRFQIHLKEEYEAQFRHIKHLMQHADAIINCGDAGQEGELIQRWVMQLAQPSCPVKRLWINSMTDEAIREGFENLRPQDDYQSLYEAGLCRSIGDWLLGMNATRLYTLKYGRSSQNYGRPQPLSIGRVQTPTLALIVKRYWEIQHFKPEPYWVLSTIYRDVTFTAKMADEATDMTEGKEGREGTEAPTSKTAAALRRGFSTREEGEAALKAIEEAPFCVTAVQKRNGSEAPPRLFDLTSLQVECNKKFGYGSDLTLQLIQQLYEGKLTTYPRVDTTFLPDDVYPKCAGILNGIKDTPCIGDPAATSYADYLGALRGKPLKRSKKVFDSSKVTDHHAIIPTGVPPRNLTDMQRNVFDLIARRFIAVFYPDCQFATTTVEGEVEQRGAPDVCMGDGRPIAFKATGKVITAPGWRIVVKAAAVRQDGEQAEMPPFVKGESGPHTPTLTEKTTQPPKPYTEATLLRAMETAGRNIDNEELRDALKENGIGRPSTRAQIIKTLFTRGYMRLVKKSLEPTPTGIELIGLIKEELLKSAELTGIWEKKLRQIERHEYAATQFVAELKEMVSGIVDEVMRDPSNRRIEQGSSDTPKATAAPAAGKSEAGKPKRKIIRAGSVCPKCGEGKVIKGHTAYGCSRWREGCDWRKPFS